MAAEGKSGADVGVEAAIAPDQKRAVKPKTHKGKRALQKREPKLVEDAKNALVLYGGSTTTRIKGVLTDLHTLKTGQSVKLTRKNEEVRPFEAGGEASLEFLAQRSDCQLFVLGSHNKKRPHNLTLGRLYGGRLYDALELGVEAHTPIAAFSGAALAQAGNKPCIIFVGERFDSVEVFKLAKSMLLDFFRGEQVQAINLAGVDRVLAAYAVADQRILLRQYAIRLKKSGTKVPRVTLQVMGPSLDLIVRRSRLAPPDLEQEAMKQPRMVKSKVKNVGTDLLDGKVGRIYMPKQDVDKLSLAKMKGLKRERRKAVAGATASKRHRPAEPAQDQPRDVEDT